MGGRLYALLHDSTLAIYAFYLHDIGERLNSTVNHAYSHDIVCFIAVLHQFYIVLYYFAATLGACCVEDTGNGQTLQRSLWYC